MPHFEHDCERCKFIGSFEHDGYAFDAYESCDGSIDPFIARYGIDGEYETVSVRSRLYRVIRDLRNDPNTILVNLRNDYSEACTERDAIFDQLVDANMKIRSIDREIAEFQNNWTDRDLAATESEAENGAAY